MSVIKWGMIAAGGTIAALIGLAFIAETFGWIFAAIVGVGAATAFMVALAVTLVRRLWRSGIDAVRSILDVPQAERFDSSEELAAEIAAAPETSDDLRRVAERIRRVKKAAHGLRDRTAAYALERVGDAATALLADARVSPAAARQLRSRLVHQFGHVEAIALNLMRMEETGADDKVLAARATGTLMGVAEDFIAARRETSAVKTMETEARLELLDRELKASTASR